MNALQQESVNEKIDQLETKINLYNENAEKLGEEGKIEDAEAVMEEVEKFKKQKAELEAVIDHTVEKKDKNMKVCEVCGALQSASDTDKRLTMHLEGKLHTGYLKIRKKLGELKNKRASERRSGSTRCRRSTTLRTRCWRRTTRCRPPHCPESTADNLYEALEGSSGASGVYRLSVGRRAVAAKHRGGCVCSEQSGSLVWMPARNSNL